MKLKKILMMCVISFCMALSLHASNIINGKVVISGTEIPIYKATITHADTTVYSNKKGLFTLPISTQNATIVIQANGYTKEEWLVPDSNPDASIKVYELKIKTVIKADKQKVIANREEEKISYYYVPDKQIKRLSENNLFADTMSAIKMLPGVGSKSSFDAQMYIRGGAAYEIVGVLDNVPIFQPYHWGGRVSLFNAKVAQKVEFYPGGYDARGGQSLSGIIDVYTKDGSFKKKYQELDINMTEMNYYGTFPITTDKTTTMVSYRRTYYDLFAPLFIKSDSGKVNMPYLQSFQGKLVHKLSPKHKLKLGIYGFNDGADVPLDVYSDDDESNEDEDGKFVYDTQKYIVSTQLDTTLGKNVFNEALLAFYQNKGDLALTNEWGVSSIWKEKNLILRDDISWKINEKHSLESGIIIYQVGLSTTSSWEQQPNPYEPGSVAVNVSEKIQQDMGLQMLYLQDRWALTPKTMINAGVRLESVKVTNFARQYDWQPRLSIEQRVGEATTLKTYYGKYGQQNYLTDSTLVSATTMERNLANITMDRADHYGMGLEHYLSLNTLFKTEVFYKDYDNIAIDMGRYPEIRHENKGVGHAKGLELMLQKVDGKHLEGWMTYTLSSTRRTNKDGWYTPEYDIRHMLNVYGDLNLNDRFTMVTNIKISTGTPYTPILGSEINPQTGAEQYIQGAYLSKRLPTYFRTDVWFELPGVQLICPIPFLPISDQKIGKIFPTWKLNGKTRIGFHNVFNRKNPTQYTWDNDKQEGTFINDFPFMIIFGYNIIL